MTLTGRSVFSIIAGVVALAAVAMSFTFNATARVFPLATGILLFVLCAILLLSERFPDAKALSFARDTGVLTEGVESGKELLTEEPDEPASWPVVLMGFGSFVVFTLLIYFTSYLIAVPVFVVGSIVFISKGKLLPALIVAAVIEVLVFVIFELVL